MLGEGEGSVTTIYRSIKSGQDGLPQLGSTASTLGVRHTDIPVDDDGIVWPETGGMSVAPDDPRYIYYPLRPEALGGGGKHPAYGINSEDLGPLLRFRKDPKNPVRHGFVEPARPMNFDEYHAAIQATAASWRRVT